MDLHQDSNILSYINSSCSPLGIFEQFIDNSLIQRILDRANQSTRNNSRTNEKSHKTKWKDITIREFKTYIGVIIMIGIIKLSEIRNHWEANTS